MKTFNRLLSALLVLCMVATTLIGVVSVDNHSHVHADETETPEATTTTTPTGTGEEDVVTEGAALIRTEKYKTAEEKLATMEMRLSAYGCELYAHPHTGEVAIKNTKTQQIIFTNPYDANQHIAAAELEKSFSQILLSYEDNNGNTKTLNSFVDAAEQDQITVTPVKNGISVNYVIGRSDSRRICPMSTTRSFFEEKVLNYIQDENDKKRLYPQLYVLYDSLSGTQPDNVLKEWFDRRPILEKMELYVLNENATNQEKNRIEAILKSWCPHITYEHIDEQHTITEYVATASILPCFRMSLIYKLDENGLTVKLPANSIVFNEDHYRIKEVTVLPYFGAGNKANNGFTFIPDGIGSITEFKDIGDVNIMHTGSMYGADYSYHSLPTSFTGINEIMRYPVFGVVEEKVVVNKYFVDGGMPYCVHEYVASGEPVKPTCTEEGYTPATCSKCAEGTPGHEGRLDVIPAAHAYEEISKVPATCQGEGKVTSKCTVCGDVNEEILPVAAHAYNVTLVEIGIASYECTVCGDSYTVGHSRDGHKFESIGSISAVCTPGWYENMTIDTYYYKNNTLVAYVSSANVLKFKVGSKITIGDNVEGVVTDINYQVYTKEEIQAIIEAEGGLFGMTANADKSRYEVTIEVATTVADNAKSFALNLEKPAGYGYTYKICLECGYEEKTNYQKHTFKEDTTSDKNKEAKCNSDGTLVDGAKVYKCSDCGFEEVRTVKAAHKWSGGVPTGIYAYPATGEIIPSNKVQFENGKIELLKFTCATCGYQMAEEEEYLSNACQKDPLSGKETHVYETINTIEGDCFTYTVHENVCKLCGKYEKAESKTYSHDLEKIVVEPTCDSMGYTQYKCKIDGCDYEYKGDFVESSHTDAVIVDQKANTCTEDGYIKYHCNGCNKDYQVILKAEHQYEDTVYEPNCKEGKDGYTLRVCTVPGCGHQTKVDIVTAEHEWSKWIVIEDATVDTPGKRKHICKVCFKSEEFVVDAIGSGGLDYYEVTTVHPEGYVAVITEGESLATITSAHGGPLHPYNSTYITINPRPSDEYKLADALSVGSDKPWTVVSERKYTGNYTLRIFMVSDHEESKYDASVSGMAAAYRDYLVSTGTLTAITSDDADIPLYIETLGATKVQKTILSFPVYQMTALTTFDDLNNMISDFGKYGIKNVNFRLTGFANGGLYPTVSNKADFEDAVGGNDGYKSFAANANKNGIGVFTEFDMSYLHNTSLFDGYSDRKHAIETIDGRYITKKEYNPTFQMFMKTDLLAISPSVFGDFYEKLSVSLGDLGYYGISSATLGTDLNSDFDTDDPHNREDSKQYVMELLAKMKEDSKGNVMVDGGNAYTFGYANHILNMSSSSSNSLNASASVPFISMVLHGYINYAGSPTNYSSNVDYEILKMIETGANPYFLLCVQNTSALKEDEELSKYYSIAYDIWMKNENTTSDINIVDIYNRINEAMSDVQYAEYVKFEHIIGERVIGEVESEEVKAANAEKLSKLEEKYNESEKLFQAAVKLYERLLEEKPDVADNYYDNMGVRRLERNAAREEYLTFKNKIENKPGYNEAGEYVYSDFTVDDKSIVYVEYGNGIAFVLNYNNFEVTVDVNGKTLNVEPMNYISFEVTNN